MLLNLLSAVKKYPELYDRQHSDYKSLKVNPTIWTEVGRELRLPGEQCRVLWTGLKKKYVNVLKQKQMGAGNADFKYENDMYFLWPFYEEDVNNGGKIDSSDEDEADAPLTSIEIKSDPSDEEDISSDDDDDDHNDDEQIIDDDDDDDVIYVPSTKKFRPENEQSDDDDEIEDNSSSCNISASSPVKRKLTKAMRRDMNDLKNKYHNFDICGLICLVKEYPPLYDIRRLDYFHCREKKSSIWNTIARQMNCSVDECCKVWRIVKKLYFDYLDHKDGDEKCTWLYEEEMSFMHPIYQLQQTATKSRPTRPSPIPMGEEERIEFHKKLIEAVECYPALYNCTHPDFFKYRNNKEHFWVKIAETIGSTFEECRRSWFNLRKCYYHKLEKEFQMNINVKWRFKDEMSFLRPIYKLKRNITDDLQVYNHPDQDGKRELEARVVKAVQKYPVLYDINSHDFIHLRGRKGLIWIKVAQETNLDANECRRMWRTLLACYLQFLRRKNSPENNSQQTWRLENEMAFLYPIYEGTPHLYPESETPKETEEDDVLKMKVIQAVRKHPALYDIKHRDFTRSRSKKIPIWNAIGRAVGCNADTCRIIWSELRKYYICHEKRRISGASVPEWKFADAMSFYDLLISENGKIARKFDRKKGEIIYRDNKRDFERKLIELVKNCPQLYDYRRPDYIAPNEISKRKKAWGDIGKQLNATGQECSHSWRSLKKFYISSIERPVPGESPLGRKWKFKEEMRFLLPLYADGKNTRIPLFYHEDAENSMDSYQGASFQGPTQGSYTAENYVHEYDGYDGLSYQYTYTQPADNCNPLSYVKNEYSDNDENSTADVMSYSTDSTSGYYSNSVKVEKSVKSEKSEESNCYDSSSEGGSHAFFTNNVKQEKYSE